MLGTALLLALLASQQPTSAQAVVIESTEPAEDAVSVPLETTVIFNLNKPTPAMGSQFVGKFLWAPRGNMSLSVAGHEFDDDDELTIIFFEMDHDVNTDFSWFAFGVEAADGSRMAQPFALNYTTSPSNGSEEITGSVAFGERTLDTPSKRDDRRAFAEAMAFVRRSVEMSASRNLQARDLGKRDGSGGGSIDEKLVAASDRAAPGAATGEATGDVTGAAPGEATEAVLRTSSSNLGNSIVLLLNRYSLEKAWQVRKATVTDSNGAFTFDAVRGGEQYWPVAFNYADETGEAIGSYGFFDANGDLIPDSVDTAGVTDGVDFEMYPAAPVTASIHEDLAAGVAGGLAPDQHLVNIRSLSSRVFGALYEDGTAGLWRYTFYSPTEQTLTYVAVDPINYFFDVEDEVEEAPTPLPENYIDSDTALQIAEDNGGADFRAAYESEEVSVELEAGDLNLQVRPPPGEIFWRVTYEAPEGEGDDELTIFVDIETGEVLTAIDLGVDAAAGLPRAISLLSTYPNPFRGSTTLSFALDRPEHVRIGVYDLLGRKVAAILDARRSIGEHRVTWDAAGRPAGVYVFRVWAGGAILSKPVLLSR